MQDVQLNGRKITDRMSIKPGLDLPTKAAPSSESNLTVRDLLWVVWRRLWVVMLVAALLTGMAVGASLMQTPVYEASTEVLVGQKQGGDTPAASLASDITGLQQITQTVVEAVDSRVVAEDVIEELGLQTTPETFLGNLGVQQVPETQFIQITYMDTDPERAQKIANTVAEVSSDLISEVSPSASAIIATVWDPAIEPTTPVSPEPVRNGILALLLGIMLGMGLAFLLEHLDDSWRSPEEVERVSGVPTFGIIPKFKAPRTKKKGGG